MVEKIAEIGIAVDSSALEQLSVTLTTVEKRWVSTVASIVRQQGVIEKALKASSVIQTAAMESVTGAIAIKELADWGAAQRRRLALMAESEKLAQRQAVAEDRITAALIAQEVQSAKAKIANQGAINTLLGIEQGYKSAQTSADAFTDALRKQEAQAFKTAQANQGTINKNLNVGQPSAMSNGAGFGAMEAEMERLALKFDKGYASSQLFKASINELNRAEQLGAISTKQHAAAISLLEAEFAQFNAGTANLTNRFVQYDQALVKSNKELVRYGMVAQQVGYQVGDFLVQVQSGQSVLVAFAQQGTQLAGLLPGVAGAVIGIGLSLSTALLGLWMKSNNQSEEATAQAKTYGDALDTIKGKIVSLRLEQDRLRFGLASPEETSIQNKVNGRLAEEIRLRAQIAKDTLEVKARFVVPIAEGQTFNAGKGGTQTALEAQARAIRDRTYSDNLALVSSEALNKADIQLLATLVMIREESELQAKTREAAAEYNSKMTKKLADEAELLDNLAAERVANNATRKVQLELAAIAEISAAQDKADTDAITSAWLQQNNLVAVHLREVAAQEVADAEAERATKARYDARMNLFKDVESATAKSHAAVLAGLIAAEVPFKDTYVNWAKAFDTALATAKEQQSLFRTYSEAPIEMKIKIRAIFDGLPQMVQDFITGGHPFAEAMVRPKGRPANAGMLGYDALGNLETPDTPTSTGGGGGGGTSIQDQLQSELDDIKESSASKAEVEMEGFNQRQETLKSALDSRLLTLQEYNDLELQITRDHRAAMSDIDTYKYGTDLEKAGKFFGEMATATQSGGDKIMRISKVFGAAQALINSYVAFSEVLKAPGLSWWARIPAAVGVLGAGLNMVNAIKSVGAGSSATASGHGGGGGRGSPSISGNSGAPQTPQRVIVQGINPDDIFTGQWLSNFFENFYKENNDRGTVFMVNR